MDRSQADAIAQAILSPDPAAQEALRRKRAKEDWLLIERRKIAWLTLVGFAIGIAIAYLTAHPLTVGGLWGAILGSAIGGVWVSWRSARYAA